MTLPVMYRDDVRAIILAGVVLTVKSAASGEFISGALAAYQHQALACDLAWPAIVKEARKEIDGAMVGLLDVMAIIPESRDTGA